MSVFRSLIVVLLLFSFSVSFAQSLEKYHKRFFKVKDVEGNITSILDLSLNLDRKFSDEIEEFKTWYENNQYTKTKNDNRDVESNKYFKWLMNRLNKINVNAILNSDSFNKVVNDVDKELEKIKLDNYRTVAVLNDSSYYYNKRAVGGVYYVLIKIVEMGLSVSGPAYDLASFFVKRFWKKFKAAKRYHQNILQFYIENFDADELLMSSQEKRLVLSSLMEADINILQRRKHKLAISDWNQFGINQLAERQARVKKKFEKYNSRYSYQRRISSTFATLRDNRTGNDLVLNGLDRKSFFNGRPSISIDWSNPKRIMMKRVGNDVIRFAVSFSPVPGTGYIIKEYIETFDRKQIKREGQLYGYYESLADTEKQELLIDQTVNPFEKYFRLD